MKAGKIVLAALAALCLLPATASADTPTVGLVKKIGGWTKSSSR